MLCSNAGLICLIHMCSIPVQIGGYERSVAAGNEATMCKGNRLLPRAHLWSSEAWPRRVTLLLRLPWLVSSVCRRNNQRASDTETVGEMLTSSQPAANKTRLPSVGSMLERRRRQRAKNEPTMGNVSYLLGFSYILRIQKQCMLTLKVSSYCLLAFRSTCSHTDLQIQTTVTALFKQVCSYCFLLLRGTEKQRKSVMVMIQSSYTRWKMLYSTLSQRHFLPWQKPHTRSLLTHYVVLYVFI